MARRKKLFIHNTLRDVSFRTEEGLPLVPTPYMKLILESILLRALSKYNITLCHGVVMGNHVHFLMVVQDPAAMPGFVGYFKRESAHAINRLLGRRQKTVWSEGYDAPIILDHKKAIEKIVYAYTNPQRANLESTISKYPNVNTWKFFNKDKVKLTRPVIVRDQIPKLSKSTLSLKDMDKLTLELRASSTEEVSAYIEPSAWLNCFAETANRSPKHYNNLIRKRVKKIEDKLNKEREGNVIGRHGLILQRIEAYFRPKKYGKKMLCLSTIKARRIAYISFYKNYCKRALKKINRTKGKHDSYWYDKIPPGLFAPGGFLSGSLIPIYTPTYQPY